MARIFLSFPTSGDISPKFPYFISEVLSLRGIDVMRMGKPVDETNCQAFILSSIKSADALVAIDDFSKPNANVMLEIGYAIGAGRPVLLLSENPSEIPLSLSSVPALLIRNHSTYAFDELIDWIEDISLKKPIDQSFNYSASQQLNRAVSDPDYLELIDPQYFERLIKDFITEIGLTVYIPPPQKDDGFDFIIHMPSGPVPVIIKKYALHGRLGIGHVQKFRIACEVAGMHTGFIITNNGYTISAREFAIHSSTVIHLLNLEELICESRESLIKRCDF